MVFSTPFFLFFYLPVVLLAYYVSPLKWRNGVLLLLNLIFYGWGEPIYILIMFLSIAIDYTHGLMVEHAKAQGNDKKARRAVAQSVIFNLALLFFFKYWDFVALSLASVGLDFMPVLNLRLPIGISFYTFQTMSYTIDVYRGDAKAQKNIVNFGTFVTLFPQLIAGPIIKYKDLGDQIDHRECRVEKFASGIQIFLVGMAKKVLLANNLGMLWDVYKVTPLDGLTTAGAWLGVVAFALQLYFDFSGYSDMAIGLGRMLGFEFLPNFDHPYISQSVTEFWRRWHISLGSWFRQYVYIPMGGNRVSKGRLFFNLMVVWGLTGIWHGASWNYLIWGLYFGLILILEKGGLSRLLERLPRVLRHLYTVFLVLVSWVIFAVEDLGRMGGYLKAMFGRGAGLSAPTVGYYLLSYLPILLIAAAACLPMGKAAWEKAPLRVRQAALPILALLCLVLCTAYLVDATYNPFLYFRF